jgi:type IX secretion system PorP/SprF family membrane protein
MKKIYFLFIGLLMMLFSNAQQIGVYSHFFFKPMVYNPAFTGTDDAVSAMIISRSQWTGFKGAPQLNIFTVDGNINKKAGLGVQLISDRKGLTNRIGGNVSYSYRLIVNDEMHLSFGVAIGVIDQTIDFSRAVTENNIDPVLFNALEHTTSLDANAGLAFNWKGLDIGVAVPQLIGNKINYVDNTDVRSYYTQARHYMGSVKYKIPVLKDKGLFVTPLALVRFLPNTPIQYDGTLNIDWKDKLWVGATYKNDYAVGLNVGVCIHKQLSVGYSYDFITGKIGNYSGMSHEIMVSFKFGSKKSEPVVVQPPPPVVTPVKEDVKKTLENKAYEERMDSLQRQLKESQDKLRKLSEKLDEQLKAQQQKTMQDEKPVLNEKPVGENRNVEAVEGNVNKVMVEGVWVITNQTNEFKDDQNHEPEKGFYVIVGTFIYRDLAVAETRRFNEKGFKTANWVYYEAKKYNYVFTERALLKDAALAKAKEIRQAGVKDVWIQELIKDKVKGK